MTYPKDDKTAAHRMQFLHFKQKEENENKIASLVTHKRTRPKVD
jgi:hypothetical protein